MKNRGHYLLSFIFIIPAVCLLLYCTLPFIVGGISQISLSLSTKLSDFKDTEITKYIRYRDLDGEFVSYKDNENNLGLKLDEIDFKRVHKRINENSVFIYSINSNYYLNIMENDYALIFKEELRLIGFGHSTKYFKMPKGSSDFLKEYITSFAN